MTKKTKGSLLAERLAEILIRLQQGDVHRKQLAEELGVTERTTYRDLHDRLALIVEPVKAATHSDEGNDCYRLISEYRGKFSHKDILLLAHMLGADNLFPENSGRNFYSRCGIH